MGRPAKYSRADKALILSGRATDAEIAARLGVTVRRVQGIRNDTRRCVGIQHVMDLDRDDAEP